MKTKVMSDEEFFRKYKTYEDEALRETIAYLIEHRQKLRDKELVRLEKEADTLLKKLERIEQEQIVEEIKCFKEILSLQKRLIENGEQRN